MAFLCLQHGKAQTRLPEAQKQPFVPSGGCEWIIPPTAEQKAFKSQEMVQMRKKMVKCWRMAWF